MRLSGINAMWIGYRLLEPADTPDVPTVDGAGCLKLQSSDGTWHCLQLFNDPGQPLEVTTFVVQANASAGVRGYVIMTADDATKHKLDLILDGEFHRWNIDPSNSAEASDYSVVALGYGTAARHNVTMIKDTESPTTAYTLHVNQTANP